MRTEERTYIIEVKSKEERSSQRQQCVSRPLGGRTKRPVWPGQSMPGGGGEVRLEVGHGQVGP